MRVRDANGEEYELNEAAEWRFEGDDGDGGNGGCASSAAKRASFAIWYAMRASTVTTLSTKRCCLKTSRVL